jgi:hypothetical protein
VLDRANVNAGQYVFELDNADVVTLANLSITGAFDGIFLNNGSTLFTLQNSIVYENANSGLDITDAASSSPTIKDNLFYGDVSAGENRNQNYGVFTRGQNPTVLRNQAYHTNGSQQYGMYLENVGSSVVVRDNVFFHNSDTGLVVLAAAFEASGNVAFNNGRGFYYDDNNAAVVAQVHDDLAFGNTTGFELRGAGEYYNLRAHDNGTGIYTPAGSLSGTVHDITSWRNTTGADVWEFRDGPVSELRELECERGGVV